MSDLYHSLGFDVDYGCCHSPKWVKVGEFGVFCSGYTMFEHSQLNSLDVFVGLGEMWKDEVIYIPPHFERFVGVENKIIVVPMEDGKTMEAAVNITARLLLCGFRVGVGCHGGHGRTGWLIGRLIRDYEGLSGPPLVRAVRERLCRRAVETGAQLLDLGVKVEELKEFTKEPPHPKVVKDEEEKGGESVWWHKFTK